MDFDHLTGARGDIDTGAGPAIGGRDDQALIWTHQNYSDIKNGSTGSSNRTRKVLDILRNEGWKGWPTGTGAAS